MELQKTSIELFGDPPGQTAGTASQASTPNLEMSPISPVPTTPTGIPKTPETPIHLMESLVKEAGPWWERKDIPSELRREAPSHLPIVETLVPLSNPEVPVASSTSLPPVHRAPFRIDTTPTLEAGKQSKPQTMEDLTLNRRKRSNRVRIRLPETEKQEFIWTKKSTALLIHSYRDRILQFRYPKQKKKALWGEIVKIFKKHGYRGLTENTIDTKFRNMKKTFKTITDNNKKTVTGRGRITWEYFEDFQQIFQNDRTINFGPTISSMQPATLSSPSPPTVSSCASRIDQPSTSYTTLSSVQLPSSPNNSPGPESHPFDPEETLTPPPASSSIPNAGKGKRLYELRKKQLEIEERDSKNCVD